MFKKLKNIDIFRVIKFYALFVWIIGSLDTIFYPFKYLLWKMGFYNSIDQSHFDNFITNYWIQFVYAGLAGLVIFVLALLAEYLTKLIKSN